LLLRALGQRAVGVLDPGLELLEEERLLAEVASLTTLETATRTARLELQSNVGPDGGLRVNNTFMSNLEWVVTSWSSVEDNPAVGLNPSPDKT
jgi:hypothetical protein